MIQWQAYRILNFIILLVVLTNCIIMWDSLSLKYCVLFEYTGKTPTTAIVNDNYLQVFLSRDLRTKYQLKNQSIAHELK